MYFCFVCAFVFSKLRLQAGRLPTGRVRFCSYWSVRRNCNVAVFPQEKICLGWQKHSVVLFHILSPSVSIFLSFSLERGTELSKTEMWAGSEWPSGLSPQLQNSLLWDLLIPRYYMFIKCSHCYKQENAIGLRANGAKTQVRLRQWTGVHFSTVSQWDRRKHIVADWKLARLSSDLPCRSVAQSPVVGHTDSGQCGEAWIHPKFLSFAFRTASFSLPLSLPLSHISRNWLKP